MAGNKHNTEFKKHIPQTYTLQHGNVYGNVETFQGDAKQVIRYILNQQL